MNEYALPFKYEYTSVLTLVGTIAYSMYLFYLLWLTTSALISMFYFYKQKNDTSNLKSKRILSVALKKISFIFTLGILPALVILSLDYIWLVGNEFSEYRSIRFISFLLFTISSISLFIYNNSFYINVREEEAENTEIVKDRLKLLNKYSGWIGVVGLVLVLILESILYNSKLNYQPSNFRFDLFENLLDFVVYIRLISYFVLGFGITFILNLFYYFLWEENKFKPGFQLDNFQKKLTDFSLMAFMVLPTLILIDLILLPRESLSYWIFISSGIAVILIFLITNQLYAFKKENNESLGRFTFYLTIIVVVILTSKDVVAIENLLKPKTVEISQNFVQYETELKNKLNIKTVVINGEEIFIAKCSACHRFDTKLVGPPFNLVLQKYENNREQLVKFILNPVKVDPQYPPMPSQGLIPPEAEAVADYIMRIYKENKAPLN